MGDPLQEALDALGSEGADLAISSFSAALLHYKRATVALPWPPSEAFGSGECKDFEAARRAIDALPPLQSVIRQAHAADDSGEKNGQGTDLSLKPLSLEAPSLRLLDWLISPSAAGRRCPRSMRRIGTEVFLRQLRDLHGAGVKVALPTIGPKAPDYVFENMGENLGLSAHPPPFGNGKQELPHSARPSNRSLLAWHGTSFERLHSIISAGLQPASGTRLQRNGANHGEGIYLSTDYEVAWSFCNPAPTGWRGSCLGNKLRAMLVCQVDTELLTCDNATEGSSRGGAPRADLPETYLLVHRPDAVRITHVLLFVDECNPKATAYPAGPGPTLPVSGISSPPAASVLPAQRIDWLTVIVVAYVAFMLLHYVIGNRQFRHWMGLR